MNRTKVSLGIGQLITEYAPFFQRRLVVSDTSGLAQASFPADRPIFFDILAKPRW